jgi:hypothetical protein
LEQVGLLVKTIRKIQMTLKILQSFILGLVLILQVPVVVVEVHGNEGQGAMESQTAITMGMMVDLEEAALVARLNIQKAAKE